MYLKCKNFAKTKKLHSKKVSASATGRCFVANEHDILLLHELNMLPWATVFLPVHKYSVS